jgi:hypothetical protein
MKSDGPEHCEYIRVLRRDFRSVRAFHVALNARFLIAERGNRHLKDHRCGFGLVAAINMRPVLFDGQTAGAGAGQARYVAGQRKLDRVNDAALAGTVGTAGREILAAERQLEVPNAPEFLDMDVFNADHGESGNKAERIAGSVEMPSSRITLRSRTATSAKPSSFASSVRNVWRIVSATDAAGVAVASCSLLTFHPRFLPGLILAGPRMASSGCRV